MGGSADTIKYGKEKRQKNSFYDVFEKKTDKEVYRYKLLAGMPIITYKGDK